MSADPAWSILAVVLSMALLIAACYALIFLLMEEKEHGVRASLRRKRHVAPVSIKRRDGVIETWCEYASCHNCPHLTIPLPKASVHHG